MISDENKAFFKDKEILITGGTGTMGNEVTKLLCECYQPKGIRIFSRDELKQKEMEVKFKKYDIPISYLLGDIRDLNRLNLALKGVDYVIHTAALKDIVKCEKDPTEAIRTNIEGSKNVIMACLENKIKKCMFISTDKAVYPVNLYGSTKMVAERLFISANSYCPKDNIFSVCRYGNVIGSRGSVIQLFQKQKEETNILKITSLDMTRFWITINEVAHFILDSIVEAKGKDIHIPRMEGVKIVDVTVLMGKDFCGLEEIGIRESEKLHECLISLEESYHAIVLNDKYVIDYDFYNPVPFTYSSDFSLMSQETLKRKLKEFL
jgi:FlaA1/EpsC-like NDP-sugar epimerase